MSSCSSEVDVIRTRISTYDDDNTVLYAYEPNTAYFNNQGSVVSNTSCNEEQQKTILNVLTHCQVIYDAIQKLDKKLDVVHAKVRKIKHFRVKSWLQSRKPLGYAFKDYNYLLSKKIRYQKMRKKRCLCPSPYPKSYSPTIPVQRPEKDSQSNPLEAPFGSPVPLDLERSLSLSPTVPSTYRRRSYEEYYSPQDPTQGSSSPEAHNTRSLFLDTQSTAVEPATVLTQSERSPAHSPDMMTYPALLENSRFSRAGSPLYVPTSFGPSSPVGSAPGVLKQSLPDDPSTWSVDEVILFLKYVDPQLSSALVDLFMQHDIDGKALLLLKNDMMMKYMGLKLGTALKLRHYIEMLKDRKIPQQFKKCVD
ncbi:sex comb on midleg-like protein 1 isoform X1 [Sagmatias obliquidens]|uniref:sex comb on midleg-like protein 1 isoform X1 n=1 Tax=Sagmatias obliquidens TaxID=3371155 RepID=UPI000F446556|nr:sex comb on midleg-like protein 1 isoform X1 [Lagenorhynchus obliquidens]XP_026951543.1 sex comb on midleg-like protein 1 isoform X1 [Lagenorhynchus obliquidens]XP_026951544.1 sex comb on midleg-like protein 1 isoform X1 [Lagenorhynchus obliquidens]